MTDLLQHAHPSIAGCRVLTLDRPQQRNCLSRALLRELQQAIDAAAADPAVRVIVIAGNGSAFCAGHDLGEITAHREDDDGGAVFYRDTMRDCAKMMTSIVRSPTPVVARVHGIATAAGCQLVASCDLAVAAGSARFATPGVNIGLFCSTPMVALSRNVGRKQAMEMLLLGEAVEARDALQLGLVNRSVPDDDLDAAVDDIVARLAAKPAYTVAIGKQGFYRQLEMTLDDAYEYVSDAMVANMLAADAREGIAAFLEKRHPVWPE